MLPLTSVAEAGLQTAAQKEDYLADYIAKWGAGRSRVSFQQFLASLQSLNVSTDGAYAAFVQMDVDGSGTLDIKELCRALLSDAAAAATEVLAHNPGMHLSEPSKWHKHAAGAFGRSSLHRVGCCVVDASPFDFTREVSPWQPPRGGKGPHSGCGGILEAAVPNHFERGGEPFPGGGFAGGGVAYATHHSRSAPQLGPLQNGYEGPRSGRSGASSRGTRSQGDKPCVPRLHLAVGE